MSQSTPTAVASAEGADRHPRPRRDHPRRLPGRPAHAGLRRARIGQDAARHHLPRQRRPPVRRARRVDELRGERRGARPGRRVARLRSRRPRRRPEARRRLRPRRPQRDRGNRRVRPRGAVRPPRTRRQLDRRQARRARHDRVAVRRPRERSHPPRRAAPAVPVAAGSRPHGGHYRRAGRDDADPPRARGIRDRRGHPARSSRATTRFRRAGSGSSSIAARTTAPTSIRS